MAQEARAEQRLLDALVAAMPAAVATQITAITADSGVTLPALALTEAREDIDTVSALPHLAIMIDGESIRSPWMTVSTDLEVPLRLVLTHHVQDTPALADQYSWYYARALELALIATATSALLYGALPVGIWWCRVHSVSTERTGEDRNRRIATVTATVYVRTRRSA